jgi:hypothetical protein
MRRAKGGDGQAGECRVQGCTRSIKGDQATWLSVRAATAQGKLPILKHLKELMDTCFAPMLVERGASRDAVADCVESGTRYFMRCHRMAHADRSQRSAIEGWDTWERRANQLVILVEAFDDEWYRNWHLGMYREGCALDRSACGRSNVEAPDGNRFGSLEGVTGSGTPGRRAWGGCVRLSEPASLGRTASPTCTAEGQATRPKLSKSEKKSGLPILPRRSSTAVPPGGPAFPP